MDYMPAGVKKPALAKRAGLIQIVGTGRDTSSKKTTGMPRPLAAYSCHPAKTQEEQRGRQIRDHGTQTTRPYTMDKIKTYITRPDAGAYVSPIIEKYTPLFIEYTFN